MESETNVAAVLNSAEAIERRGLYSVEKGILVN